MEAASPARLGDPADERRGELRHAGVVSRRAAPVALLVHGGGCGGSAVEQGQEGTLVAPRRVSAPRQVVAGPEHLACVRGGH